MRRTTNQKKNRIHKKISIKWILLGTMGVFAVFLLVVLWLLQTVYLDSFYQHIKMKEIHTAMDSVADAIDDSDLNTTLERLAEDYGICSLIISEDGTRIAEAESASPCVIHRWSNLTLAGYQRRAHEEGSISTVLDAKEYKQWQESREAGNMRPNRPDDRLKEMPDIDDYQRVVLVKEVENRNGELQYIFLNSMISPVDATVHTLQIQLVWVSVIMIIIAVVLAAVISRVVAKPIIRLNHAAKQLGGRDFNVEFNSHEYKEVAELSTTLNHAAVELGKAEKLQKELIANVSHDLRTPLTMIIAYAEVMRDLPGENSSENLQVIIDEANRLTMLVNDMLDISKIQSGVASAEKKVYNLTGSIGAGIDRYAKLMENEGYRIRFEYDCPAYVEADEFKIYQVIYNLVSNAINYTGADKTIVVRQLVANGIVRIEVIDSGEGIPQEELENVWERYYKVDKTHKRAIMGTGLGLSIVQSVLRLHGADYGVMSEVGRGSCFWFELPVVKRPEEQLTPGGEKNGN